MRSSDRWRYKIWSSITLHYVGPIDIPQVPTTITEYTPLYTVKPFYGLPFLPPPKTTKTVRRHKRLTPPPPSPPSPPTTSTTITTNRKNTALQPPPRHPTSDDAVEWADDSSGLVLAGTDGDDPLLVERRQLFPYTQRKIVHAR